MVVLAAITVDTREFNWFTVGFCSFNLRQNKEKQQVEYALVMRFLLCTAQMECEISYLSTAILLRAVLSNTTTASALRASLFSVSNEL